MTTLEVNKDSYATYEIFDSVSYTCIEYLMEKDELIWKLLKYNTPDAWDKTDLTWSEKAALIYNGQDDTTKFSVFMDTGQPEAQTKEKAEIRIHPYSLFPDNRVFGSLMIQFEVYCHYHVNTLSNYKTRVDMIAKRLMAVFNGANIGGIGRLHMDNLGTYGTKLETGGQLPFRGKWIMMSNKAT